MSHDLMAGLAQASREETADASLWQFAAAGYAI